MTNAPAFQLYAQDFLVGTADMTAEEVGGYMRLLCYQWVKGGVPDNDEMLCKLSGCAMAAITVVKGKFSATKNPTVLRNKKLERVRRDLAAFRQRQSKNAANSWRKRKSNDGKPLATHMPEACSSPSPSSSPSVLSRERESSGIPKDENQAAEWASMAGVPPEFAKQVYHQANGRNWLEGAGQPIGKWKSYVKYRFSRQQSEEAERKLKPQPSGSRSNAVRPLDLKTIRDAKETLAVQIHERFAAVGPMGTTWSNDAKRQEWILLKSEIKKINQQLSSSFQ